MDREKQIEEMAKDIYSILRIDTMSRAIASMLYDKDYRKIYDDHQRQCTCYALGCQMAEELKRKVAREIFEEIEKYNRKPLPECEPVYIIKASEFAELKKKYTEEKLNG